MPRPMWRGTLSFGLVSVPVELRSAVRDMDVHLHQVHRETHERIEQRRVLEGTGEEVAYEDVGRGYEDDDGTIVPLTDDELSAVLPARTRTVDLERFVDLGEIDPVVFDHPYWLLPTGEGDGPARAYVLLARALRESGRVGVGRIVLRSREHLVALREQGGLLSLTTMRYADDLRDPADTGTVPDAEEHAPGERELGDAVALLEEMTTEFRAERYEDCHRTRLLRLIEAKREDGEVEVPAPEAAPTPQRTSEELVAALEESLRAARG